MTEQKDQDMQKTSKQLDLILSSAELHGMIQKAGALTVFTGLRTCFLICRVFYAAT